VQEVVSSNPIINNLWKIAEKNMQPIRWVTSSLAGCANIFFLVSSFGFFPIYILPSASLCRVGKAPESGSEKPGFSFHTIRKFLLAI
jgi:hypothetical protein